jgi:hypothetical protein
MGAPAGVRLTAPSGLRTRAREPATHGGWESPLISRCTRTTELDVYHLRREGDNSLDNAQVLCRRCQAATQGYELPGRKPPAFDTATKIAALSRAGHQCECTRIGACHGAARSVQAGDTSGPALR